MNSGDRALGKHALETRCEILFTLASTFEERHSLRGDHVQLRHGSELLLVPQPAPLVTVHGDECELDHDGVVVRGLGPAQPRQHPHQPPLPQTHACVDTDCRYVDTRYRL